MKKYLFLTLLTALTSGIYAQGDKPSYGPAPYRTLEQTIGETFIILPADTYFKKHLFISNGKGELLSPSTNGMSVKLLRLDEKKAYFRDSVGTEYYSPILYNSIKEVVPLIDLQAAKSLINKKFWLNLTDIYLKPINENKAVKITGIRFEPVTIIDVNVNRTNEFPFTFIVKTSKGEIAMILSNISGTNTDLDEKYLFNNVLLSTDPKLTYHFTPAVWKMVQGGYTEIGMPMDAFKLVMGTPRDIHSTQTAKGTRQQWVYGNADHPYYYYFEGGKLVAKQN